MSKEDIVYHMMILNVNRYANVILERSLRVNEGHIGVNESVLTIMKQIWALMNGYFLEMNSKRCKKRRKDEPYSTDNLRNCFKAFFSLYTVLW